jgi:hypothetical protein
MSHRHPEEVVMAGGPRYGQIDEQYGLTLATTEPDDDGPVWMVNLMKYREKADYLDGHPSDISGREADDLYTPYESLAGVGAEIVFAAEVETQLLGDAPVWDRVGVVKYPTRRAFIEMQARDDFQRQHAHKEAGMQETIVMGTQPIDTPAGDHVEVDWADVPHPPTDDDGPVTVVHVLRFNDVAATEMTPEHMQAYQAAAAEVAVPHGVRLSGWFAVEGTILGDGRSWHQVRFNTFPSRAAFMAVVADPARLAAQGDHREVAIADTYTMITRPLIDELDRSAGR